MLKLACINWIASSIKPIFSMRVLIIYTLYKRSILISEIINNFIVIVCMTVRIFKVQKSLNKLSAVIWKIIKNRKIIFVFIFRRHSIYLFKQEYKFRDFI